MSQSSNFIVELFIRTLEVKHKLTFEKDKAEYFKVLFDTYLNGQGNPEELKDYIAAAIDNQQTIDIIADQVIEWQGKAAEMKAAEEAKKSEKEAEASKMNEYVATKTKKAKQENEGEKKEEHGRKRHKRETGEQKKEGEGKQEKGQGKGLKGELSSKGKQKCKFYPFCKNPETCEYFHPTEKCTYFPNCRYGQSCLYEHEACKFKEKCMKPNCPFAHPFKKTNPIEEMMKTFMSQHNPLNRGKKKFHKPKEQAAEAPEEPKKE